MTDVEENPIFRNPLLNNFLHTLSKLEFRNKFVLYDYSIDYIYHGSSYLRG
jgi:hypothetical protein